MNKKLQRYEVICGCDSGYLSQEPESDGDYYLVEDVDKLLDEIRQDFRRAMFQKNMEISAMRDKINDE